MPDLRLNLPERSATESGFYGAVLIKMPPFALTKIAQLDPNAFKIA
jgi:hypothetical protein